MGIIERIGHLLGVALSTLALLCTATIFTGPNIPLSSSQLSFIKVFLISLSEEFKVDSVEDKPERKFNRYIISKRLDMDLSSVNFKLNLPEPLL
jgi:hypothetical protein